MRGGTVAVGQKAPNETYVPDGERGQIPTCRVPSASEATAEVEIGQRLEAENLGVKESSAGKRPVLSCAPWQVTQSGAIQRDQTHPSWQKL